MRPARNRTPICRGTTSGSTARRPMRHENGSNSAPASGTTRTTRHSSARSRRSVRGCASACSRRRRRQRTCTTVASSCRRTSRICAPSRAPRRAARSNQGTLPERDDFFEAGLIQRIPRLGMIAKLSAYHKRSDPGIDDNTVPGSSIVTDVNIAQVRITGLESVLEFRPGGPFTGYMNAALNHAYGVGTITGGFFPERTTVDVVLRPRPRPAVVDGRQRDLRAGPILPERNCDLRFRTDERSRSGRLRLLDRPRTVRLQPRDSRRPEHGRST